MWATIDATPGVGLVLVAACVVALGLLELWERRG